MKSMELMASNTLLLSENVGDRLREFVSATNEKDDATERSRKAFNELTVEMESEMRLESIHRTNAAMLVVVNQKELPRTYSHEVNDGSTQEKPFKG